MSGAVSRHLLRLTRSLPLPTLKQGTTLSVRSSIPNVSVRVESGWRDDGHVTLVQRFKTEDQAKELGTADLLISQEADQMTSLGRSESYLSLELASTPLSLSLLEEESTTQAEEELDAHYAMTVEVPEKVNLICELDQGGNIEVASKIEGDVKLSTTNGTIRVKKLRGHTIELETKTEDGYIFASDLLEAQNLNINLQGGRLRAKRIHGDTVDIRVGKPTQDSTEKQDGCLAEALGDDDEGSLVDISSMYVSGSGGAQVFLEEGLKPQKRGVRIKSHHGPAVVNASGVYKPSQTTKGGDRYPLVELGSVNGSCEVSVGGVPNAAESEDWVACQVHYDSISAESVSLISAEIGNVGLTIDRKLEADIRLLSALDAASLEMKASLLADDDDTDQVLSILANGEDAVATETSRISITTPSFTQVESFVSADNQTEFVEGWVENKSQEPDSRFEMKNRGGEAGKIRHEGAANQALKNFSSPLESAGTTRPLIVAATTGSITLETLSWLGAIARRYGLDEKGRELGRQASRRGRKIIPADE